MGLERRFAILIGSNGYKKNEDQLAFSVKDMNDVASILQVRCEFQEEDIIAIEISSENSDDALTILDHAFVKMEKSGFIKNMHTFLFFYSGHGEFSQEEGLSYLLLSDQKKISTQKIIDKVKGLSPKNSYVIIDACHSGSYVDFGKKSIEKEQRRFHYHSSSVHCLFGATSINKAFEPNESKLSKEKIQNGFITHFFIEALNTYSKYTDGFLGFPSIYEYVSLKVQLITQHVQIPVQQSSSAGLHPLAVWKQKGNTTTSPPRVNENYQDREEEELLIKEIEKNGALLITGKSRCGKSEVAKKICKYYWEKGDCFYQDDDVNNIIRKINSTTENSIFLLEDPFENTNTHRTTQYIWRQLDDLIYNLPKNVKLIICSREEILKKENLTKSLGGLEWFHLNNVNRIFLLKAWQLYCEVDFVKPKIVNLINDFLTNSEIEELLQVGQLRHLAKKAYSVKFDYQNIKQLCHLAREDADQLASEILNLGDKYWEVCSVLTLTSTTISPVSVDDLNYVISQNIELLEKSKIHIDYSSIKDFENLSIEYQSVLDFLEKRDYIIIEGNQILTRHPIYKEAFNYVLFNVISEKKRKLLHSYLNKGLNCASPYVAETLAKQIPFFYDNLKSNQDFLPGFIEIIINSIGTNSLVSVRDLCNAFSLKLIKELNEPDKENLFGKLMRHKDSDLCVWINGYAYYKDMWDSYSLGEMAMKKIFSQRSDAPVKKVIEKIESKSRVTSEEIYEALQFTTFYEKGERYSYEILKRALSFPEVFIRSFAALKICMFYHQNNNKLLLDRVFSDEHPEVIVEGIKGLFLSYEYLSTKEQLIAKNTIEKAFENEYVLMRASIFITNFATDYSGEVEDFWIIRNDKDPFALWKLWGEIYPTFMANYPSYVLLSINPGRYIDTIQTAAKKLDEEVCWEIASSIIKWLQSTVYHRHLRDHEMEVIPLLKLSSTSNSQRRFDLIKEILLVNDTHFTLLCLSEIVEHWSFFNEHEKDLIKTFVDHDRIDKKWIHAYLSVQDFVPSEIQNIILGAPDFLHQEVDWILNNINEDFLETCLKIYHEELPITCRKNDLWDSITDQILSIVHPRGCSTCLKYFLFHCVNGTSRYQNSMEIIWKNICANYPDKNIILDLLVWQTVNSAWNYYSTPWLWSAFIESYIVHQDREELIETLASKLELFTAMCYDLTDILKLFGSKILSDITEKLPTDSFILQAIDAFNEVEDDRKTPEVSSAIALLILHQSEQSPIRIIYTFYTIKRFAKEHIGDKELYQRLLNIPNGIRERGLKMLEMNESRFTAFEPEDWLYGHIR